MTKGVGKDGDDPAHKSDSAAGAGLGLFQYELTGSNSWQPPGDPNALRYATGPMQHSAPAIGFGDGLGKSMIDPPRHATGANFLLADGHAQFLAGAKVSAGFSSTVSGCGDATHAATTGTVSCDGKPLSATFNIN